MITKGSGLTGEQIDRFKPKNVEALTAFQERKVNGMGLSKYVWNIVDSGKAEFELALDVALGEGRSAAQLSRDIRKFLKDPDMLFRRVRDKEGNLYLSKRARNYHPGRGVYRSSYKNAMRLTRTEINMAYHTADYETWKENQLVLGYEIILSNNHIPDICDELAGKYPKDFKFVGWHPQCRCVAVPITPSKEDFLKYANKMLDGEDVSDYEFEPVEFDGPDKLENWAEENRERAKKWANMPYFVTDNPKYVPLMEEKMDKQWADKQIETIRQAINDGYLPKDCSNSLDELDRLNIIGKIKAFKAKCKTLISSATRHAMRTEAEKMEIQERWNAHRIEQAGETAKVKAVRAAIEKKPITGFSDIKRIMKEFYKQFPEEFNYVDVDFISFNGKPKGFSYISGYSEHDKVIAFNSHKTPAGKDGAAIKLLKAFENVRLKNELARADLRSIDTVVHELLHQKASKHANLKPHYRGDYKRTAMETMNELASRSTAITFLRRIGANTKNVPLLLDGNGYEDWVDRLLSFINESGCNPTTVGKEFASILTTKAYDTMDFELYNFFKVHAKKNFTQTQDEVLAAFESGKDWDSLLIKWFR